LGEDTRVRLPDAECAWRDDDFDEVAHPKLVQAVFGVIVVCDDANSQPTATDLAQSIEHIIEELKCPDRVALTVALDERIGVSLRDAERLRQAHDELAPRAGCRVSSADKRGVDV